MPLQNIAEHPAGWIGPDGRVCPEDIPGGILASGSSSIYINGVQLGMPFPAGRADVQLGVVDGSEITRPREGLVHGAVQLGQKAHCPVRCRLACGYGLASFSFSVYDGFCRSFA